MMRDLSRRFAALAVIGAIACAAASAPAEADLIGLVKRVKSSAYGTPPGSEREKKFRRFPVVQDELLETGSGAGMLVEFLDETTLTLGADASLMIDTFVYDPATANVTTLLTLSVGTLRFISGKVGYATMQIVTPTAAIAIRGATPSSRSRPTARPRFPCWTENSKSRIRTATSRPRSARPKASRSRPRARSAPWRRGRPNRRPSSTSPRRGIRAAPPGSGRARIIRCSSGAPRYARPNPDHGLDDDDHDDDEEGDDGDDGH